jgi:hypothetical protein
VAAPHNKAHLENESKPIKMFLGYTYLIINIPSAALCSTVYRMDKAGVSGYIVMVTSAIVYSIIVPFIYIIVHVGVSH